MISCAYVCVLVIFSSSRISKFGHMHECLMECYDFMLELDQIEGCLITTFLFLSLFQTLFLHLIP
jgi:hypothetical protein